MTRHPFLIALSALALLFCFCGAASIANTANAAGSAEAAKLPSTTRAISHADIRQHLAQPGSVTILDLRRTADYDKDTVTMQQAQRFDPTKIAEWSGTLPKEKEIVLYCDHGRSISNASVDYLTKAGYKARLVHGGFDAWKDTGGATMPKLK